MTDIQQWRTHAPDLDRLDCDILLAHALDCNRAEILAHPERTLGPATICQLDEWHARRRSGEPLAYILQTKEFWGLEFIVNGDVLIPRPDTELLVEQTLAVARADDRLLELGTGCGAPAIAIAVSASSEDRPMDIVASDISQAALCVARRNGKHHAVDVTWMHSDWFSQLHGTFNLILSNPPYVASDDEHLHMLMYEPQLALVGGADGLTAIRHIVTTAPNYLASNGWLLLEHGHQQGPAVCELLRAAGYLHSHSECDLGGHARVSMGRRPL